MNYDKFIRDTDAMRELEEAEIERQLNPDFALISDYVCGALPADKASEVRARLDEDPEFRDLAEPLLLAWSVPKKTTPMSHEELLRKWLELRRRAGMPPVLGQEEEKDDLGAFLERRERARRSAVVRRLAVAAVFVALMLVPVVGIWWNNRRDALKADLTRRTATTTIQTWQPATVPLPDGSTVTLAAGSTLRFNQAFANGREVHLVGEGQFEVGKEHAGGTFTVTTETAEVTVVGTSFTVTAFGQAGTHVTVQEGSVRVRRAGVAVGGKPDSVLVIGAGSGARVFPGQLPELVRQ